MSRPTNEESSYKSPIRMAYVVCQYPMLSMTFVIREVLQLRKLDFHIDVASLHAPDRKLKELTENEADEASKAYYVIAHGVVGALRAFVNTIVNYPSGFFRGWKKAFALAGLDIIRLLHNLVYLTEALMIGVWMEKRNQKHLHAHLGSNAATVAMFVKEVFGFNISITVHGPDEFYDAERQYLTEKIIKSDFICCISHFARSQMAKLSPYAHWHKFEVVRLGVDPKIFTPRAFVKNPEVFEVICVGRLCPSKGQHVLVDAVKKLVEQGREIRLRIVGDGEDRNSLELQVQKLGLQNQVVFEGAVNQNYICALYARADVFSIPSFAEGLPVVLMEAMSMEIPCVTTRIAGIPELIRNGKDGLLVAASDVDGIAEAIARLMDDSKLRYRLGKQARKRVIEYYNLQRNVKQLAEVFRCRC